MNHTHRVLILLFFILSTIVFQSCRPAKETLLPSEEVARDFICRVPDPDSIHWVGETNHFSWQAGYIMFAMEKMWIYTGDSVYYNYIKRYVDQQVNEDGNIPDFRNNALDNFLPGYAITFMYETTGEEKYKKAATKVKEGFSDYPRAGNGLFLHASADWARDQVWVDGVFMGQIFLARYGKSIGNSEYAFNEVVSQILNIAKVCQKDNGLLLHAWNENKTTKWADSETGTSPEVWSEGMGWYAVLMADIFDFLPENQPEKGNLLDILKKMCAGLKDNQNKQTGMWCQVVDKCNEPGNWDETSGTGMFLYLFQKSVNKGYISKEEYQPVIDKAYQGLLSKKLTNEKGFIDLIDCSSIGVMNDYQEYISQPREVSPFAAFGSYIIGTGIYDFDRK